MKTLEIAFKLDGELSGDPDIEITGVTAFKNAAANRLTFLTKTGDEAVLSDFPADACVLVPSDLKIPKGVNAIKVEDPKFAFAVITPHLLHVDHPQSIHKSLTTGAGSVVKAKYVGANVTVGLRTVIGVGTQIHESAAIGNDVVIGAGTVIHPNTVVYDGSRIGENCILHAGSIIGAAGFGYVRKGREIVRFPQIGTVLIENNVEIGANTCVDRGALGETRIGSDTKIDNLVQIAHNVSIGERVLIAAQVGISGSVVIEDDVVIGGQVGIADHVTIKTGAVIGARSAVFPGKIVRSGVWAGTPVQPIEKYKEQNALIRSLARLKKDIYELKKKLK